MGLRGPAHPSQCKWKTLGCGSEYQNKGGILFCCYIHRNTCSMNKMMAPEHVRVCTAFIMCMYLSVRCALHVSAHMWFLHVASNVYLMWPCPAVCRDITTSDLCQCSWMVSIYWLYPSGWPRRSLPIQAVCWAVPTALLRFSYSTQHVLFITCCHELSKAAMTNAAFLFMKRSCWPHTSNHDYHPQLTASAVQKKLPAQQERHEYKEWSDLCIYHITTYSFPL